ncbi:hypothetical protein [Sulfurimonas sp.]|uniref:hypothetical protein n=1 Tax=Sulfurimonas sp. TaxID=2022749 RepID=UPI002AB18FB6|nr:hypothetical protein [Sulfurimonas sp.]
MKKFTLLLITLFISATLSSNELSWVDTQVEAIKPPRKGMETKALTEIHSPFIYSNGKKAKRRYTKKKSSTYKKPSKVSTTSTKSLHTMQKLPKNLVLSAVINKSALINGEWYNLNDSLYGYKLSSVKRTTIILSRGESKVTLSTRDKKQNLKFK